MQYNIETLNADFSEKFEKRLANLTNQLAEEYQKIFTIINVPKEIRQQAYQEMLDHFSDNSKKQAAVFIELLNKIARTFHVNISK